MTIQAERKGERVSEAERKKGGRESIPSSDAQRVEADQVAPKQAAKGSEQAGGRTWLQWKLVWREWRGEGVR